MLGEWEIERGALQDEGTASIKTLWWERAWPLPQIEGRPKWSDWSEPGKMQREVTSEIRKKQTR